MPTDFTIGDAEARGLVSADPELRYVDAHAAWVRDGKPYRGWRSYLGVPVGCGYKEPSTWKAPRSPVVWADKAKAKHDGAAIAVVRENAWVPF